MVDTWQTGIRALFSNVVLLYGGDSEAAWAEVKRSVQRIAPDIGPDDFDWAYEILTKKRDCTLEEGQRTLNRYPGRTPLLDGIAAVLKEGRQA